MRRWLALVLVAACGGGDDGGGATADAGPPDAPPAISADEIFDHGVVRHWELTIPQADLDWLNAHAQEELYVMGTVSVEQTVLTQVGIRYKGSFGTLGLCFDQQGNRTCPKLSMKLKFSEYLPEQRLAGLKRLNFHAMKYDPSAMKDHLAYGLFNAMGVPAPRTAHARLSINGVDQGLFAVVEEVDGELVQDRFAAEGGRGNLYKEVWPVSDDPQIYKNALETNEEIGDVSRMVRFAGALRDAADGPAFRAALESWTDLPSLVAYLAVDRFIDHWDGIVGWYCVGPNGECFNHNYYWYEESAADRLWLLPWDMDNTMQAPNPIRSMYGMPDWDDPPSQCGGVPVFLGLVGRPPACDRLIDLMSDVLWEDYSASTQTLLAGPAAPGGMEAEIDQLELLLAPEVATDDFGPTVAEWQAAVSDLRADLTALRARVP